MEKIFKTLSKYSQIPISEMNPNTNIVIDLGMSSLEILSCVFDLEEEFNVRLHEEELKNVVTIKDLMELINRQKKK